jgi:MSHA pilin protein MshA
MNKQQKGFTLIELVMVIVILGILAAVAFPKFADLSTDARKATLAGALGSIKSAAAIVHAKALVTGNTSAAATLTIDNSPITIIRGYPTANAAGIGLAAQVTDDFTVATGGTGAGATVTVMVQANCFITYTAATAVTSVSAVITNDTGC